MLHNFLTTIQSQLSSIDWAFNWLDMSEILIIVAIVFAFYKKFIQNTQSEKLVKGIFFLVLAWIFSEMLISIGLTILGVFLKTMISLIALSLIVIFQPE